MRTILIFIGISVLSLPIDLNAQERENAREKLHDKPGAVQSIKDLKQGVLLICIHTDSVRISALRTKGYTEKADELAREQKAEEAAIKQAATEHYNFSDYYFFYSHDMDEVRKGDYDGRVFDKDGKPVTVTEDSSGIFILDSRYVQMDHMGTDDFGISIRDNAFEKIERPFPYYVRKRSALWFLRRDYEDMFSILNRDLTAYYESNS